MADDTATNFGSESGKSTSDAGSTGKPDGNAGSDAGKQTITTEQFQELQSKLDSVIEDRNKWKGKAKELETNATEATRKKAETEGNVEALKESYERSLTEEREKITTLQSQLHSTIAEQALTAAAAKHGAVSVDQIVRLFGDRVTVHEENGKLVPAVKNAAGDGIEYYEGKAKSPEKLIAELAGQAENANLFKSSKIPGTGAQAPASGQDDGRIPTLSELRQMPDQGAGWLARNPDKIGKVKNDLILRR